MKINNEDKIENLFSEHAFIASCLKIGLTIRDLEERTFVFIMKVLFSYISINREQEQIKTATQTDIDRLMR